MCSCPVVALNNDIIEQNEINSIIAYSHAQIFFKDFLNSGVSESINKLFLDSNINSEPIIILDHKNRKLFYEFNIENENKPIGTIKIFANKLFGSSVATIELQPRYYNPNDLKINAIEFIKNKYPKTEIISTSIICYSYPKIGIKVELFNYELSQVQNIIIDASNYQLIGEDSHEIWSLYDQINYSNIDKPISEWTINNNYVISQSLHSKNNIETIYPKYLTLDLYKILPIGLHGQINEHYCTPATGQMIAHYYNVQDTQEYVGNYMHTTTTTTIGNELNYYQNRLGKTQSYLDNDETWEKAKAEIDANRPISYHIPGHTRVCAGYLSYQMFNNLYIYDPWPVNTGREYWETWGLIQPDGAYIYVK